MYNNDTITVNNEQNDNIATFMSSTRLNADDIIFIGDIVYKVISVHFRVEKPNSPADLILIQNVTVIERGK